jgi:hypothetical protein
LFFGASFELSRKNKDMVALLTPPATLLREESHFAPAAGRPPPEQAAAIWALHRTLVDPRADVATVKRAKAELLRAVATPDDFPPSERRPLTSNSFHEKENSD